MAYIYLVYRVSLTTPIHCSDLIGKVGKGTGKRTNAYRTPYCTHNLNIDIWPCISEDEALEIEGIILNLIDMRGWLRCHTSGRRSEVLSFPLNGKTQDAMITEYTQNMKWLYKLIAHIHGLRHSPKWTIYSHTSISVYELFKKKLLHPSEQMDKDIGLLYGKGMTLEDGQIVRKHTHSCICM